ncbi:tetratricopeptide repeat protein [candidate division KSB1 bacterium]|nr:tetratricopeptide repeat protein [candidate division KSB1 bacterium]
MLFDTEDEKVYPVTIGEANLFLNLFPQTKPAPDILFRLASSYEERKGGGLLGGGKEVKNAVVLYLKFLYFYPGSIRERDAQNRLKKLVIGKKDFEKTEQDILALIRKELSEKDKYLQYVDYLEDLARLNDDDIKELALTECNNYLNAFKEAEKDDQVIVIMGDLLSQLKRYEQAVSAYQKIEYLYPESYYYARALYNIGKLYAFQLKKRDEASNILQELVIKYPKDTYSGFAQYLIAELAEKKKKGERQAIAEYQKMVENYPQHLKTPDALLAMGRIYSVKLKQYQEAIKSYEKIAFQYPQSGMGGQALALAGEVYEKKLKRYNEAAEKYIQIADLFPQDSLVLPKLMEAAGLYESKVKERTKAINTYQRVISNFPGTKEAEGARKKIEKLK